MLSWYIDSSRNDKNYLDIVKRTVEPCMDYLCDRLSEIEDYDLNDLNRFFKEIVDELPILTFYINKDIYDNIEDGFHFRYNNFTTIKFNDGVKGVRREIILNKILG